MGFDIPSSWEWVKLETFVLLREEVPRPIKVYLTDEDDGVNWIKLIRRKTVNISILLQKNQTVWCVGKQKDYSGDFVN